VLESVLDVVIVNWNSGNQLKACLQSMKESNHALIYLNKVIVVDNASTDYSIENLNECDDLPLTIVRNPSNRGFGAACNQGAALGNSDYILFLNPDTMLMPNSLDSTFHFLASTNAYDNIGILGVQLIDENGKIQRTCARFPTLRTVSTTGLGLSRLFPYCFQDHFMLEWPHDCDRFVDQVIGAFFMVRRSLFQELNGFDERFFVYYEEVDFAFRAHRAGWLSYYLSAAQVYHRGGGTTGQIKATRLFYLLRSRSQYFGKHYGKWGFVYIVLFTFTGELVARLFSSLLRGASSFAETLKGYLYLLREPFKARISGRKGC
jgi:N-acetylglucosaminyl-diphospho-decaprenol L-rhamnosyltransferase